MSSKGPRFARQMSIASMYAAALCPPGSLIEILQRCIKSPEVQMLEDVPHPLDVERLQVAGTVGVRDQSLLNLRVIRLPQRQPRVEAAAH